MPRLSLTPRAVLLVPLLAVAADQARAALACGPGAEGCLQAAAQGWAGGLAALLLVLFAAGVGLGLARLLRGGAGAPARHALGAAALLAACGGQVALVALLGDASLLGGGFAELAAMCAAGGALLALALRLAPALVRGWEPAAPRLRAAVTAHLGVGGVPSRGPGLALALAASGRGPPAAR